MSLLTNMIARIVADNRRLGWLIVLALTIPPVLGFCGLRLAPAVEEGWVAAETVAEFEKIRETFRFDAPVVLMLEADDFFTGPRATALHATVEDIRALPIVQQLLWLGDVPEVTIVGARVRALFPDGDGSAEDFTAARETLLTHPLSSGSLISDDGKSLLLLVKIDKAEAKRTNTEPAEYVEDIRAKATRHLEPAGIRTRITGFKALYAVHDQALAEDHIRVQVTAYVLVSLLAVVIFRRPVAIMIACGGPVVGMAWTLGWLQLIGQSNNALAQIILPVMVMMIGFTDSMHMVIRVRQLRADGTTTRDAVYKAVRLIGPACFLTSITTAIGFGSLMLSESGMISGFGRVSAIGVGLTFFAVVLVTPLLANSWLGNHMHVSAEKDPLARVIHRCVGIVEFSSRRAAPLAVLGVLITCGCLYASFQLIPDDRLSDRVPHDSEAWQAMRDCDETFGGVRYLRLIISWDEGKSRNDIWPIVKQSQELLAEEPLIGPSASIRSCLNIFRGRNVEDRSILANQLPDHLREQFYRADIRKTQVVARQRDRGIAAYEPVVNRLEKRVQQLQDANPGFQILLYSDVMIEGRAVRQMIEELLTSLVMASLVIFSVLAIAFRSLRVGLISILPNIMPLACSGALRLVISDSLGIASACSFAICLGIAVDDTIHYLIHYRHERHAGRTPLEANRITFTTVGSALLMTTVVMMVGLGTVMTSQMPPHFNFAAMACTTLAAALVADLLFLPAMLSLFPGRTPAPAQDSSDAVDEPPSPAEDDSAEHA